MWLFASFELLRRCVQPCVAGMRVPATDNANNSAFYLGLLGTRGTVYR